MMLNRARNSFRLSIIELFVSMTIDDIALNLRLLDTYAQVDVINDTLEHRRQAFQTRQEYLHKRRETLHERELHFKQRLVR
jgi:hypothetical protein